MDLAVDLDHPALKDRLGYHRNLDYPNVSKGSRVRYVEAFGSYSSAHAIACAGIVAADQWQASWDVRNADGSKQRRTEPGCLGIAPGCTIVPYRAMTLTEPVVNKRQMLARAVLEAATGIHFEQAPAKPWDRAAPRWMMIEGNAGASDVDHQRCHVLFLPLPLEPLPKGEQDWLKSLPKGENDPLALALAFAATRIPVIVPSGNKGTSNLSNSCNPGKSFSVPPSIEKLAELLGLDQDTVRAVFQNGDGKKQEDVDRWILETLTAARKDAPIIAVGACNDRGERSRYSQYGDGLTVVAPSDDVLPPPHGDGSDQPHPRSIATTDLRGAGGYMQDGSNYTLSDNEFGFGGTSAAAAQVTGVAPDPRVDCRHGALA